MYDTAMSSLIDGGMGSLECILCRFRGWTALSSLIDGGSISRRQATAVRPPTPSTLVL
jgi:hypothetical protein